jgi:hypothetical protein
MECSPSHHGGTPLRSPMFQGHPVLDRARGGLGTGASARGLPSRACDQPRGMIHWGTHRNTPDGQSATICPVCARDNSQIFGPERAKRAVAIEIGCAE